MKIPHGKGVPAGLRATEARYSEAGHAAVG